MKKLETKFEHAKKRCLEEKKKRDDRKQERETRAAVAMAASQTLQAQQQNQAAEQHVASGIDEDTRRRLQLLEQSNAEMKNYMQAMEQIHVEREETKRNMENAIRELNATVVARCEDVATAKAAATPG